MNARHLAIGVAASFALAGCGSTTPAAAPPPGPATTAAATVATSPAASPTATETTAGGWCALVQKLSNQSGLMVGTHFISPLKETLDQFKVATQLYLANAAALDDPSLPPNVRAAMQVQGTYFKALADHNFGTDTPVPPGLKEATDTINTYDVTTCGFVFDK